MNSSLFNSWEKYRFSASAHVSILNPEYEIDSNV